MKEVVAIIRLNMMNKTKDALLDVGVPAFNARDVLGRGRGLKSFSVQSGDGEGPLLATLRESESKLEAGRFFAKRMLTVVVPNEKVEQVVKAIIKVNQTGNPGDGKIFVLDLGDAVRVRTGESGDVAIS
jgi:nitrogen regulatory protein PII 2